MIDRRLMTPAMYCIDELESTHSSYTGSAQGVWWLEAMALQERAVIVPLGLESSVLIMHVVLSR